MARVRLVHWHADEARERAGRLETMGHRVAWEVPTGPVLLRALREDPPDAIVIDLSRLPAQGRDLGIAIRAQAATRRVPLVFVGGASAKVEAVRTLLPGAVFTSWEDLGGAIAAALAAPPVEHVAPPSVFAAYEGRPLVAKLAVKAGTAVALVAAPEGFEDLLGELPEGVELRRDAPGVGDLALWFVRSPDDLDAAVRAAVREAGPDRIWILWPKKSSGYGSEVTQPSVRAAGLAAGLVDYKICSVDATWSGLLFRRR